MVKRYLVRFFNIHLAASRNLTSDPGFNRGDNNQTNVYEAVLDSKARVMEHLWAIELGNEPDRKLEP